MAVATAMYHSGRNPLKRIARDSESVVIPKGLRVRRLHKAFLRYHDPNNWPLLREALRRMGRAELIGSSRAQLIPAHQPLGTAASPGGKRPVGKRPVGKPAGGQRPYGAKSARSATLPIRTQHTGLPSVPARVLARVLPRAPNSAPARGPVRSPARPPVRKTARDRH
jgi:hypothetical protein